MTHDPRLIKHEDTIEDLKPAIPDWIKNLKRPGTPSASFRPSGRSKEFVWSAPAS